MNKKQIAAQIIGVYEGFRNKPYLCSAGIPTIGKGTTIYPDGKKVIMQDKSCTEKQADEWLMFHLEKKVFPIVDKYDVNDKVYISLCSFVYNIGSIGGSVKRALEKKPLDINALGDAIKLYNKERIDGKLVVNTGLYNRTKAEVKYFMEVK